MGTVREAALRLKLIDGVSGPAKGVLAAMKGVQAGVKAFNRNAEAANTAFRSALTDAALLAGAMALPIRAAARLEDAMADVAKVSSLSGEGLASLRSRIIQISREVPMAADELAGLAAELAAAGTQDGDLERMTLLVARAGTAFGVTGQVAGENLGKIRAALGLTVPETERLADVMNALSDGTASSATDLMDFQRRVGSMGKQYGYSADQVLAIGSAMISAGATAEQAATGFQAVGRALVKGNAATGPQEEAYKRLGLTSKRVAKDMVKDALGTTQDVLRRIRDLPEWERASVMNQLFGDEARTFLPLVENTGLLAESLRIVGNEGLVAGSVLREFETRIGTTSGKVKMLRNRVMAAAIAFGNALLPSVKDGSDALGGYADRVSKFIEGNQEMTKRLTLTAAGMVAARVALTGLRAGMYAVLRPSNLLLAALGYLAYSNFDQLSGALRDLTAVAVDLSRTQFAQAFVKGAREGLEGMASAARELAAWLASVSREGTALRQWLDSMAGAGAGEMLGKLAVGLGAVGATAAILGKVVRPLGAIVRLVAGLGRAAKSVRSTAAALEQVNSAATRAGGIQRPSLWSALLGAAGAANLVADIPADADGLQKFLAANGERSARWNKWLEENVGSPRRWLGLDQPSAQRVRVQAPPPRVYDQGEDANRANYQRQFGGEHFEGGWHRVGRGAAPVPGKAATATAGDTNISAPVSAPISLVFNGVTLDQTIAAAKQAAEGVVKTFLGNLDAQLNRSSQTQFGGLKPYGEE